MTFIRVALTCLFLVLSADLKAGWFFRDHFYVVVQKNSSGEYLRGWVVEGLPKNENGIYVFTPYAFADKNEIRISTVGVTIIDAGSKLTDATRIWGEQTRSARRSDGF